MKFTWKMFLYIALFYAIVTVIYWQMAHEVVGITALALSTGLALIIGYYFWFTDRRIGAQPQDRHLSPRLRLPGARLRPGDRSGHRERSHGAAIDQDIGALATRRCNAGDIGQR